MPFASALRLSACAAALLFVACAPDKDPLDTLTTVTAASNSGGSDSNGSGNSGGSGNTGGTDGTGSASGTDGGTGGVTSGASEATGGGPTGGTTGGGPVPPAQACLDFLTCVDAASPDQLPQFDMAFGPDSQCWTNADIAQSCAEQCAMSLGEFATLYPDVPECGGGGNTSDSTTNDTGPVGEWGNCGWDAMNSYYACLGMPGEPDPDGTNPIDCPVNLPEAGSPCDRNSEINDIGCCTPTGDNYYCGQNGIVVESCG